MKSFSFSLLRVQNIISTVYASRKKAKMPFCWGLWKYYDSFASLLWHSHRCKVTRDIVEASPDILSVTRVSCLFTSVMSIHIPYGEPFAFVSYVDVNFNLTLHFSSRFWCDDDKLRTFHVYLLPICILMTILGEQWVFPPDFHQICIIIFHRL